VHADHLPPSLPRFDPLPDRTSSSMLGNFVATWSTQDKGSNRSEPSSGFRNGGPSRTQTVRPPPNMQHAAPAVTPSALRRPFAVASSVSVGLASLGRKKS